MSYILDALKKSDNERQKGSVPDLRSQHTVYPGFGMEQKKKPKTFWLVLLSIVFVAASLTVLFLVAPYMPFSLQIIQKDSATAADTITADRQKKVPAAKQPLPQVAAPAQPTPQQPTDQSTAVQPEQLQQTAPQATAPAQTTPQQTTSQSTTVQPEQLLQPPQRPAAKEEPATIPPAEESVPEETGDAFVSTDSLPYLRELPQDVRTSLPKLSFAGHTYSSDPARRMIIVNNQIKREGQWVEKGLLLEQITWDGVVLNYEGLRFQVLTTR